MPASTIGNRRQRHFDKLLELRSYDAAALSASGAGTPVALTLSRYEGFKVVVDVAAYTGFVATTAQWSIAVEVATTSGGTYTALTSVVPNGTVRSFGIPLSGDFADQVLSGAAFIRVNATKTGSPGNLTYGAYISPIDA